MPGLPILHRDLTAALDEIEALIAEPELDQLRLSRVRLYISKVNGERRNKVDALCEELSRQATGVFAEQLAALRQSNIEKRIEYTVHVGTWGPREVAADWPGYCRASVTLARSIREKLEVGDDRVADLHLWRLGPGHTAVVVTVVSDEPQEPEHYKERLHGLPSLSHVTVEVQRCPHGREAGLAA